MITFILVVFSLLLLTGTPIAFALGITAVLAFLKMDAPTLMKIVPMKFYSGVDMFALMAMPFFMLAGDIMNRIQITNRLVRWKSWWQASSTSVSPEGPRRNVASEAKKKGHSR